MKKNWYVSRGNASAGPFEESVILSLRSANIIGDEVFLWKKGMKNWDFAGSLLPAGVTEAADNTTQAPADDRKPLKLAVLGIGVTAASSTPSAPTSTTTARPTTSRPPTWTSSTSEYVEANGGADAKSNEGGALEAYPSEPATAGRDARPCRGGGLQPEHRDRRNCDDFR